jgi:hypothetical protein
VLPHTSIASVRHHTPSPPHTSAGRTATRPCMCKMLTIRCVCGGVRHEKTHMRERRRSAGKKSTNVLMIANKINYLQGCATDGQCVCHLARRAKRQQALRARESLGGSGRGGTASKDPFLESGTCTMCHIKRRNNDISLTLFERGCPCRRQPSCCAQ